MKGRYVMAGGVVLALLAVGLAQYANFEPKPGPESATRQPFAVAPPGAPPDERGRSAPTTPPPGTARMPPGREPAHEAHVSAVASPSGLPAQDIVLVDRADAVEAVEAVLRAHYPQFVERCWKPIAARFPDAAASRFVLEITVDAAGREQRRLVASLDPGHPSSNDPDFEANTRSPTVQARVEVLRCLSAIQDLPVSIEAPGQVVHVSHELQIP